MTSDGVADPCSNRYNHKRFHALMAPRAEARGSDLADIFGEKSAPLRGAACVVLRLITFGGAVSQNTTPSPITMTKSAPRSGADLSRGIPLDRCPGLQPGVPSEFGLEDPSLIP